MSGPAILAAPTPWLAAGGLLLNALVWGVSWWPFRHLQSLGLHPLWSTALMYALVVVLIAVRRPQALRQFASVPVLWVLAGAAGCTNAAFNWAVSIGDVVRVVLLFYLMPLWSVLLARLLLGERLTAWAALRVALALAGAAVVLKPPGAGWPLPSSLPDWLGLAGGISFALNNVMLRREAHRAPEGRALAMFFGGMAVAGGLALALGGSGHVPPPPPRPEWVGVALLLTASMLVANLALQYGAGQLSAAATSVIMLMEVVFAASSAVLLGDQQLTTAVWIGGLMIVAAALLAAVEPEPRPAAQAAG